MKIANESGINYQNVQGVEPEGNFNVHKLSPMDILRLSTHLGDTSIALPRNDNLDDWVTFIQSAGKHTDVLQLPFSYPGFKRIGLVVNRAAARQLLVHDFEYSDMFRGEREFFAAFQGSSIFRQSTREGWRDARREINAQLSPKGLEGHEHLITDAVSQATETLISDVEAGTIPSSKIFRRFVANVLFRAHVGEEVSMDQIDRLVDSFHDYYSIAPALILGFDKFLPVRRMVDKRLEPYDKVLDEALSAGLANDNSSIMLPFLRDHDDTATDWFHTVFAGQSSLATSLEWITYNLATNQEAQAALRSSLGSPDYAQQVGNFLEDTATKFPAPTFLLRKTLKPLKTPTGIIPANSLIIVPLFALSGENDDGTSDSMYDLQFSPGLRRCLGRYLSEAIHRAYITALLQNTQNISTHNKPRPIIRMTVLRPNEEFQFEVN